MDAINRVLPAATRRALHAAMLLLGCAVMLPPPQADGAGTAPAPADESAPRSYVLFAGLDVFLAEDGARRPVIGGSESEVLVWDERRQEAVARHQVPLTVAVEPKVAGMSVTIDALRGYPVYSPGRDPAAAQHDQQAFLNNLEGARAEESEFKARMDQAVADSFSSIAPSVSPDSPGAAKFQAQMDAAVSQAGTSMSEMASTYANPVYRDGHVGSSSTTESFDGFAVAFQVSAPQPVAGAYGVLRLQYRAAAQANAPLLHAMRLFRLRQLDTKPRKVIVRQFGLTPGFTIESYEIHVYAGGGELAANTSPNRVEVTEEEAHQFLVLRHVQRHAGETRPIEVASELRRDLPPALAADGRDNVPVEVKVSADGTVAAVAAGGLPADVTAELRQVFFLPALVNGRPVAGEGTFAVGELFRPPTPAGNVR